MHRIDEAVVGLHEALSSPSSLQQSWRHIVHQRVGSLSDELNAEQAVAGEVWLSAKAAHLHRERNRLLARLSVLGNLVADNPDLESVRQALVRLLNDIQHHHERVNDLAYDAVGLDMGGSE